MSLRAAQLFQLARRVTGAGMLTVLLFAAWWLWPARLGGSATVAVVQGHSMEPTYDSGDLVVARSQSRYGPGDIVVFSISDPSSVHRAFVVHRLLRIEPDGRITTQGDNRERPDGFALTTADIVGRAQLRLPHGGMVLYLVSRWWVLALVVGLLVTTLLWPRASAADEEIAVVAPPQGDPKDVLDELDALLDAAIRALAEQGLGVTAESPHETLV